MAGAPLLLTVAPPDGKAFDTCVTDGPMIIGRSSRAGLAIADLRLSREHARLTQSGESWQVEDLGSHNGTFLNGQRVESPVAVRPGDTLALGDSRITVRSATREHVEPAGSDSGRTLFRPAAELLEERRGTAPGGEGDALRRYAERLRLLNEVHQALSRPITLGELLELIMDRAFVHLRPEEGAIYLRQADGSFACMTSRSTRGPDQAPFYSSHLVSEVADKGLAALVLDISADGRFAEAASILAAGLRSLVAAPLLDPQGSVGMIALGSRAAVRCFGEEDMELLVSLASAATLRIRNIALVEEAAERHRLEHEMALARRIQEGLLPKRLPELSGWELHALNRPSRHVSGDLFTTLLNESSDELSFMVADVAGKGVAASLLTASLEALCAGPLEAGMPPDEVFTRVSARLYIRTPPEKYATAFLGVLGLGTGRLRYANAGHLPVLLLHPDGTHRWLEATGTPLGLIEGSTFAPVEAELAPGELLVLFTDGFTEAENPDGDEFGQARLLELCRSHRGEPLPTLAEVLENALKAFTGDVPISDDRTLLLLRRKP
jgi:phosphoserine phosphatase RsbU/P